MPANDRPQNYKQTERLHYDRVAQLHSAEVAETGLRSGPDLLPPALRAPYSDFAETVRRLAGPGSLVVDVAAGTGVHSLAAGRNSAILAADISEQSLALARRRSDAAGMHLLLVVADGDSLPVRDAAVAVVTSAGSLYCFDFSALLREVRRILDPSGAWVIVDSYAHNPIYSANRFVGYWRGRRTKLAVTNIPTRSTIKRLRETFHEVSVRYYGLFSFLAPLLSNTVGGARAAAMLDGLDRRMQWAGVLAFKIVVVASRPR